MAHDVLAQAFVVVGDHNGHVGLGVKCAKEVGVPAPQTFLLGSIYADVWRSLDKYVCTVCYKLEITSFCTVTTFFSSVECCLLLIGGADVDIKWNTLCSILA